MCTINARLPLMHSESDVVDFTSKDVIGQKLHQRRPQKLRTALNDTGSRKLHRQRGLWGSLGLSTPTTACAVAAAACSLFACSLRSESGSYAHFCSRPCLSTVRWARLSTHRHTLCEIRALMPTLVVSIGSHMQHLDTSLEPTRPGAPLAHLESTRVTHIDSTKNAIICTKKWQSFVLVPKRMKRPARRSNRKQPSCKIPERILHVGNYFSGGAKEQEEEEDDRYT